MVEANHERMTHHGTDLLLVFNYASLLILQDELLQHDLHRVELPIFERTHQVDLRKSTNCQTLQHSVPLQSLRLLQVDAAPAPAPLHAPLPHRHPILQQQVAIR